MTHQFAKHVKVVCDLEVGDMVTVDPDLNSAFKNKKAKVLEVEFDSHVESAFKIRIDCYSAWICSNWVDKVK